MALVFAVLLTHAAHEGPRLTSFLQAHKLNGVDLVLRAQGLLVRLVRQRHPAVFGQRAGGVGELGALGTKVSGAHGAVHGGRVALVLIAANDALHEGKEVSGTGNETGLVPLKSRATHLSHAFQGVICHS